MPRDANNPRWGFQRQDPVRRFLAKINPVESGCWLWTGTVTKNGYGRFGGMEGSDWAHRHSWRMFRGPIPDGLELDHLCRIRHCVNPEHLEAVTRQVNAERAVLAKLRPFCPVGHAMTPENTIGLRQCRACQNAHDNAYSYAWRRRTGRIKGPKPACKWGHPFTPENTYYIAKGGRSCRTCQREWQQKLRDRRRATLTYEGEAA